MKKLLFAGALFCAFLSFVSCDKLIKKKYFVEIDKNLKTEILGDDYKTITEEISAANLPEAYQKAYTSFMVSKQVAEGTKSNALDTKILGFRLLDENKKDITYQISSKTKDSIHNIVDKITSHISKDLKNKFEGNEVTPSKIKYDSVEVKRLKSLVKVEKDEFSDNYYYLPKNMPRYRDSNYLGFYFSGTKNKSSTLHFLMQFSDEDWLFVQNIKLKIDDNVFSYVPENVETKVISGGIEEWSDDQVEINQHFVKAFENAKKVKYRLNGKQFYKDFTLTDSQIQKIKNQLKLYKYLQ